MANGQKRQPRQYIQLSNASVNAILTAIDSFNRVYGNYKIENTLILLANSWELLAKAVLVKRNKKIYANKQKTKSISCEESLIKLLHWKELTENQVDLLQQIVSLRNKCTHDVLPDIPREIQHHLFFFGCKFFKELATKHFPKLEKHLSQNFLTLSFDHMTTYAASVKRLISKLRRGSKQDKEIIWLLERGIRYKDNNKYISQAQFEKLYKDKKQITPFLKIGDHITQTDMIRIVPVQAPQNFTADINLRKGPKSGADSLPVVIKRSDFEEDFPFLTGDIAKKLNKSNNFIAKAMSVLKMKGDEKYHRSIRISNKSKVQRYSQAGFEKLKDHLVKNPHFNPYLKI